MAQCHPIEFVEAQRIEALLRRETHCKCTDTDYHNNLRTIAMNFYSIAAEGGHLQSISRAAVCFACIFLFYILR